MAEETAPAGLLRRGAALLLEAALFWLTLCLGWYAWLWFSSRRGTTPAKRMLGLTMIDVKTRRTASATKVWLREVVYKGFLPAALGLIAMQFLGTAGATAVPGIYVLAGWLYPSVAQDPRTIWDYLAGTEVRRVHPHSRPLTQDEARRVEDAMPSRRSIVR